MQQIPHPLSRILDFCMGLNIAGVRHAQLFLQKLAMRSLWMLPGCFPWLPHLAMVNSSSCFAPSSVALSASHLMVVPLAFP